jgi:hypothetical protein
MVPREAGETRLKEAVELGVLNQTLEMEVNGSVSEMSQDKCVVQLAAVELYKLTMPSREEDLKEHAGGHPTPISSEPEAEPEPATDATQEHTQADALHRRFGVDRFIESLKGDVTELLAPHIDRLGVEVARLRGALLPKQQRESEFERTAGGVDQSMMKVWYALSIIDVCV